MPKRVPDYQLIAIERWKASVDTFIAIGAVFCAAGWFDFTYCDNSQGWFAAAYLVIGPALIGLGFWLLFRGPRLPTCDADENAPPE